MVNLGTKVRLTGRRRVRPLGKHRHRKEYNQWGRSQRALFCLLTVRSLGADTFRQVQDARGIERLRVL